MPVHDYPFSSPPNLSAGATDLFRSREEQGSRCADRHESESAEQVLILARSASRVCDGELVLAFY